MKIFKIELSGAWVFKHRDDDVLPIRSILSKLSDVEKDGVTFRADSLTGAEFECKDEKACEALRARLCDALAAIYPDADAEVYTFSILDDDGADDAEVAAVDGTMSASEALERQQKRARRCREQAPSEPKRTEVKRSALDDINGLVGAEEFKALANEVATVAPEIIKNKTQEVFTCQSYLFAVNDGCGLSTYLGLMSKLFAELGLAKLASEPVYEEKVAPLKDVRDGMEPFAGVLKKLNGNYGSGLHIMSIDISEWLDKTDGKLFKDFLHVLSESAKEFVYVFRAPYLDKDVLDRLQGSLNDMLFIRTVAIAPFTNEELQAAAEKSIAGYGFSVAKNGWKGFDNRISEEKSDGKFYGLNTVNKVVRELLYKKQLKSAITGKSNKVIKAADTAALVCGGAHETSGYEALMGLVGSDALKARVDEIVAQVTMALKEDSGLDAPCLHMRFVGNPGTGKTTVARIIGKIFKEKGILRVGNFYEYSGRDFCGRYVGETAPKTTSMCRDAYGSVLFIDEAYSLYRGNGETNDFGREALDTLIAEMENHRNDLVVIMAGYEDDMKKLMDGNAGLKSRMPYTIEFPNFSREELYKIFEKLADKLERDDKILNAAHEYFLNLGDDFIGAKEFSNARFVRNLFERTCAKAVTRCQLDKTNGLTLTRDDFDRASKEKDFDLTVKKKARIGFQS